MSTPTRRLRIMDFRLKLKRDHLALAFKTLKEHSAVLHIQRAYRRRIMSNGFVLV